MLYNHDRVPSRGYRLFSLPMHGKSSPQSCVWHFKFGRTVQKYILSYRTVGSEPFSALVLKNISNFFRVPESKYNWIAAVLKKEGIG
jgi:hypothetical protein